MYMPDVNLPDVIMPDVNPPDSRRLYSFRRKLRKLVTAKTTEILRALPPQFGFYT